MDINIPKIRLPLDLSEYSPEVEEPVIYVWVNPSRRLKEEYFRASHGLGNAVKAIEDPNDWSWLQRLTRGRQRSRLSRRIVRWYAQIWSFTESGEGWSGPEVEEFAEKIIDLDPAMWAFMCSRTWVMIQQFLETAKKAPMTPSL